MSARLALAAAIACAVALGAAPPPAAAQGQAGAHHGATVVHRVKRGDTLPLLAAEFYGDRRHASLIAVENGLDSQAPALEAPLKIGLRLRIPIHPDVITAAGDTLASLAAVHLGDERRAQFLAGFNEDRGLELDPSRPLVAGQVLKVPIQLRYRAAADDTLRSIASAYLGSPRRANLVQQYNFLPDETVEPDATLLLPIHRVEVQPARLRKPDQAALDRATRHRQMMTEAKAALASAQAMWRAGDYKHIQASLAELDLDYLFTPEMIAVGVLLGSAYVALDDQDSAIEVFRRVQARAPEHELDSYATSPKIRDVWQLAAQKM